MLTELPKPSDILIVEVGTKHEFWYVKYRNEDKVLGSTKYYLSNPLEELLTLEELNMYNPIVVGTWDGIWPHITVKLNTTETNSQSNT
jgi:hypothetical protein